MGQLAVSCQLWGLPQLFSDSQPAQLLASVEPFQAASQKENAFSCDIVGPQFHKVESSVALLNQHFSHFLF